MTPMGNWDANTLLGIANVVVLIAATWRSFSNDGKKMFTVTIDALNQRCKDLEAEFRSYKDQQASILQEHVVNRREFDQHRVEQGKQIDEFKDFMKQVRDEIASLPDIIIKRMKRAP